MNESFLNRRSLWKISFAVTEKYHLGADSDNFLLLFVEVSFLHFILLDQSATPFINYFNTFPLQILHFHLQVHFKCKISSISINFTSKFILNLPYSG
jgi:hypothetical protein